MRFLVKSSMAPSQFDMLLLDVDVDLADELTQQMQWIVEMTNARVTFYTDAIPVTLFLGRALFGRLEKEEFQFAGKMVSDGVLAVESDFTLPDDVPRITGLKSMRAVFDDCVRWHIHVPVTGLSGPAAALSEIFSAITGGISGGRSNYSPLLHQDNGNPVVVTENMPKGLFQQIVGGCCSFADLKPVTRRKHENQE